MINIVTRSFLGEDKAAIIAIRRRIFIEEQQVSPEMEFDSLDEQATHVLAELGGRYVATGRLLDEGRIGRIAVLIDCRRRGIGFDIVNALIRIAEEKGLNCVFLGAQQHAVEFYVKLGFTVYGKPYRDAGIDHIMMKRQCTREHRAPSKGSSAI